jgi:hypothetical protein
MTEQLLIRLTNESIDVARETHRGSLLLIDHQDHLKQGRFDPVTHLAGAEELYNKTMSEGYSGLWGAGDITWEFGPKTNLSMLVRYEAAFDKLMERLPHLYSLCQYHKDTLPLQSLGSGLLTHRGVFLGDAAPRWNPFFTPSELYLNQPPTDAQVELMLNLLARQSTPIARSTLDRQES